MYYSQISDFQVRLVNGQTINEPIENINELYEIIYNFGRSNIAKISFYFQKQNNQFHNLILRNSQDNIFEVEFCDNYIQSEIVELSYEEKEHDFQAVINIIQNNNLDILLLPFIINPIHNQSITFNNT